MSWVRKRTCRAHTALALAALLVACASGLSEPTAADAELLRARYADVSLEGLSRGRALYIARCAGCHALKSPTSVPPKNWRGEVREMREKRAVVLGEPESEAIVRYLEAVSARNAR